MATTVSLKPNAVEISGSTSGTTTLQATAVAGTTTLTLPAATDTLVGKATTDTLTNKTLTTPSVSSPTISDGTANGVAYLNGSKVLTTGSALVFDGTNMILGGTSPTTSSGYTSFSINNATNSGYLILQSNGTNKSDWFVSSGTVATLRGVSVPLSLESTGANHIKFETNGSEALRIDSSGGLILVGSTAQKATGTTWSNPSDQRLKDNIRDYTKGTTELMQVRVREWEYNGKGGTTEGMKGLGVIADEVMTVLPDTVENYDAKLNADDEEITVIKKFDATEITWLLVKTVQEQQVLIQTLTARITALESA